MLTWTVTFCVAQCDVSYFLYVYFMFFPLIDLGDLLVVDTLSLFFFYWIVECVTIYASAQTQKIDPFSVSFTWLFWSMLLIVKLFALPEITKMMFWN